MKKCLYMVVFIILCLFWSCSTAVQPASQVKHQSNSINISDEDAQECSNYRSYQSDYLKDKNYRRCIYCNMYMMMEYNCDLSDDKVNYYNLAISFIELSQEVECNDDCGCIELGTCADSAFWALNQGLEKNKNNQTLLELGAYMSVKIDNITQAIYYLDKVISLNEGNLRALEQLSDLYAKEERYEEQIEIINMWMKLDIDEIKFKKAIGEKKQAYQALGKETTDVDKERWISDKSNMQAGIYFLEALKEIEEYEQIIDYADEMLFYEPKNKTILELAAESFLTLYDYDNARETYEELFGVSQDHIYAIEISKIFIEEEQYERAYTWAEKAIYSSAGKEFESGQSIFQRGEVLLYLAKSCQDSPELSFWDKIVYEISLEDYVSAYNMGQFNAATRKKSLQKDDYYITTPTDWFLYASGVASASPSRHSEKITAPLKDCYIWLQREVKTK